MEIQSKLFGNQHINPETIINFPTGIPGFEDQHRFKLFHQEGSEIVYWLQSLDDDELAFSVAHPSHFNIHYDFLLTDDDAKLLQIDADDELLILILLRRDDADENGQPAINGVIKSPLLINSTKRIAFQKILLNSELPNIE